MIDQAGYFKLIQEWNNKAESSVSRKPEVALFTDKDQTPLSYRYASFKVFQIFFFIH